MSILKKFNKLVDLLDAAAPDVTKVDEAGNRAAGKRVRKVMQEVKAGAQELRLEIMDEIRK